MSKHTPGPWRLEDWVDAGNGARVMAADGGPVCRVDGATAWAGVAGTGVRTSRERDANAAFIVQACNSHDELLEALEELVRINEEHNAAVEAVTGRPLNWKDTYLERARAALARARGES